MYTYNHMYLLRRMSGNNFNNKETMQSWKECLEDVLPGSSLVNVVFILNRRVVNVNGLSLLQNCYMNAIIFLGENAANILR